MFHVYLEAFKSNFKDVFHVYLEAMSVVEDKEEGINLVAAFKCPLAAQLWPQTCIP